MIVMVWEDRNGDMKTLGPPELLAEGVNCIHATYGQHVVGGNDR